MSTVDDCLDRLVLDFYNGPVTWYKYVSESTRLALEYFAEMSTEDLLRHRGFRRTKRDQLAIESVNLRVSLRDFIEYCSAADYYYEASYKKRDLITCTTIWWTMLRLFVHGCWLFDIVDDHAVKVALSAGTKMARAGVAPPLRVLPMLLLWCAHAFPDAVVSVTDFRWVDEDDEFAVPFRNRMVAINAHTVPVDDSVSKHRVLSALGGLLWLCSASQRPVFKEDLFSGEVFDMYCISRWLSSRHDLMDRDELKRLSAYCLDFVRNGLATTRSALERYSDDLDPEHLKRLKVERGYVAKFFQESFLNPIIEPLDLVQQIVDLERAIWSRATKLK
ncbi:hypothetical protein [Cyprinid herpesvirus 2]|uniref:Uncharacterized protein n=1 Tax=Cyprinid herpesvirus 2 TaxID=317878 RepID=A0A0E3T5J4_CYHV2|nr:hypothetical protein [Cyprinid herpesvirus 2]